MSTRAILASRRLSYTLVGLALTARFALIQFIRDIVAIILIGNVKFEILCASKLVIFFTDLIILVFIIIFLKFRYIVPQFIWIQLAVNVEIILKSLPASRSLKIVKFVFLHRLIRLLIIESARVFIGRLYRADSPQFPVDSLLW